MMILKKGSRDSLNIYLIFVVLIALSTSITSVCLGQLDPDARYRVIYLTNDSGETASLSTVERRLHERSVPDDFLNENEEPYDELSPRNDRGFNIMKFMMNAHAGPTREQALEYFRHNGKGAFPARHPHDGSQIVKQHGQDGEEPRFRLNQQQIQRFHYMRPLRQYPGHAIEFTKEREFLYSDDKPAIQGNAVDSNDSNEKKNELDDDSYVNPRADFNETTSQPETNKQASKGSKVGKPIKEECRTRKIILKAQRKNEFGQKCWDEIEMNICYGRCQSGEFADHSIPYKMSIGYSCMHENRIRREVVLRNCNIDGIPEDDPLRRYSYIDAGSCNCLICSRSDAQCVGTLNPIHLA